MSKTILITGSTDGIGLATANMLIAEGHRVLLHGRNAEKLQQTLQALSAQPNGKRVAGYVADLTNLHDVAALAQRIIANHGTLDVLINNAGVFKIAETQTADGLDVRFVVNTLAPYLLTQKLMPVLAPHSRVINLSSAAQAPVSLQALTGQTQLTDHFSAYAQSKLALTMWSRQLAQSRGENGPVIIAINPGSMLGSKMVRDGFGVAGGDIKIGADILTRLALADEFAHASGLYFDNDARRLSDPHPDALDQQKSAAVVRELDRMLSCF